MCLRIRVTLVIRVGEGGHGVERKRSQEGGCRRVRIHVLSEAVHVDQVISYPAFRQLRQAAKVESGFDFISRSGDDLQGVTAFKKRDDIAETGVGTDVCLPFRRGIPSIVIGFR